MNRNGAVAELAKALAGAGLMVETHVALAPFCTYGVGGPASCLVRVENKGQARTAARLISAHRVRSLAFIGRGSNVLVSDSGFDGVVVVMSSESTESSVHIGDSVVDVDAWVPMPVLARRTVAAGLTGLEWCVGIPGSVGGAVRMNAGGHGSDMDACVVDVELLSFHSGVERRVVHDDLGFHFRGSALAPHHLVLGARVRVAAGDSRKCAEELSRIVAWRREHQPGGRNAGSVFVNPGEGELSAGAIIDGCGLRGLSVGGATISDRHANFIQAGDKATAQDILDVMCMVQQRVEERTGIRLGSEVRLLGFDGDAESRFVDPRHVEQGRMVESRRLALLMGDDDKVDQG